MSHPTGVALATYHAAARQEELETVSSRIWLTSKASNAFLDARHLDLDMQTPRCASKGSSAGHQKCLIILARYELDL